MIYSLLIFESYFHLGQMHGLSRAHVYVVINGCSNLLQLVFFFLQIDINSFFGLNGKKKKISFLYHFFLLCPSSLTLVWVQFSFNKLFYFNLFEFKNCILSSGTNASVLFQKKIKKVLKGFNFMNF